MRKLHFFLIVAALCAIGVSAKTIYIWRNGVKTDLPIQTNDSITFNEGNTPTMHIWSNGTEIYQQALAVDDSITYSGDSTVVTKAFDYDHWREQKDIRIYNKSTNTWSWKHLPWANVASVTMPEAYRYPNLEFQNDSTPVWELAFNLCPDSTLDYVHMFGLWDEKSNTMRIYSYLEDLPNPNAAYCFYQVVTSVPSLIENDAKVFMPSAEVLQRSNSWNANAIANVDARPSTTSDIVMPIQRDQNMPINSGWVCFEINLSSGKFEMKENATISFTMYGVEKVSFEGTEKLGLALKCDSCGGTQTGTLTAPGNKTKKAAGLWSSSGTLFSGIASTIAQCCTAGNIAGGWAAGAAGLFGGAGAICSAVGGYKNAYEADSSSSDTLKTTLSLNLNFSGTASGKFNGQLLSTLGTQTGGVTMDYKNFFHEILKHPKQNQAFGMRKDSNADSLSLGIWNLKSQPIIYVCGDAKFDDLDQPDDGFYSLISFLDPTSIQLVFNKTNKLFDYDQIDSIQLVAYDFAFVDGSYDFSTQPYYDFYGISRDAVSPSTVIEYSQGDFGYMLDNSYMYTSTAKSFSKDGLIYRGVSSAMLTDAGLDVYNMVFSPRIRANASNVTIDNLGVSVVLEITFKDGQKRFFAERFLPQIKRFSMSNIQNMVDRLAAASAPDSVDGYPIEYTLFELQRRKALRLLFAAKYPSVPDKEGYIAGIRVRPWQDAEHPGIIVNMDQGKDPGVRYTCATISEIYSTLTNGFIDVIDDVCRETVGLDLTGETFVTKDVGEEPMFFYQGECYEQSKVPDPYFPFLVNHRYMFIYHEDANGNLTLWGE